MEIYERINLFSHVSHVAKSFQDRVKKLSSFDHVGEARGVGLVAGIELVKNKETKENFEPYGRIGMLLADACQKNGLIVRAIGDVIAICPPLVITEDQIHELFDILESSIEEVSKKI